MKRYTFAGVSISAALALVLATGCAPANTASTSTSAAEVVATVAAASAASAADVVTVATYTALASAAAESFDADTATYIALAGDTATVSGEGASVKSGKIKITAAGTYVLSGSYAGQIVVDAPADATVQLVLEDASITCAASAAIRVKSAALVVLTLAEGSDNALATTGEFDDGNVDATVFAKADLVLNGSGSLTIVSTNIGITSRCNVVLACSSLTIEAGQHGVWANEGAAVLGGTYAFTVGHDAFHVEGDGEQSFYLADGTLTFDAEGDGFDTAGSMQADGGTVTLAARDQGLEIDGDLLVRAGNLGISATNEAVLVLGTQTIAEGSVAVQ